MSGNNYGTMAAIFERVREMSLTDLLPSRRAVLSCFGAVYAILNTDTTTAAGMFGAMVGGYLFVYFVVFGLYGKVRGE